MAKNVDNVENIETVETVENEGTKKKKGTSKNVTGCYKIRSTISITMFNSFKKEELKVSENEKKEFKKSSINWVRDNNNAFYLRKGMNDVPKSVLSWPQVKKLFSLGKITIAENDSEERSTEALKLLK